MEDDMCQLWTSVLYRVPEPVSTDRNTEWLARYQDQHDEQALPQPLRLPWLREQMLRPTFVQPGSLGFLFAGSLPCVHMCTRIA